MMILNQKVVDYKVSWYFKTYNLLFGGFFPYEVFWKIRFLNSDVVFVVDKITLNKKVDNYKIL
jgi:hypothetical protein